jgi:hypothetical protein
VQEDLTKETVLHLGCFAVDTDRPFSHRLREISCEARGSFDPGGFRRPRFVTANTVCSVLHAMTFGVFAG